MVYRSLGFRERGFSDTQPSPFSSLAPEIAGKVIRELQMIGVPTEVPFRVVGLGLWKFQGPVVGYRTYKLQS